MSLFTVTFTTRANVKKFDSKGKLIAEERNDKPMTITALPYATAMSYSGCDNFTIGPYVMEDRRKSSGVSRDAGVGNGTKKFDRGEHVERATKRSVSATHKPMSSVQQSAISGNMAGAING